MMLTAEVQCDLKEKELSPELAEVIYLFENEGGETWEQETERLYDAILPICRQPELVLPADIPVQLRNREMTIEICEFPNYFIRRGSDNPAADMISQQVKGLTWSEVTFVTLRLDRNNWMEASGSRASGYSVLCCVNGIEYVTLSAPRSLDVLIGLLQSYAARDGAWCTLASWCD